MKKLLFVLSAVSLFACKQKPADNAAAAEKDPHSLADPSKAVVQHLDLDIKVDFATKEIGGKASWTVKNITGADSVIFDTWKLNVQKVTIGREERPTTFSFGDEVPVLGRALRVKIDTGTSVVNIYYTSSPDAGAVQWLTAQQTAGKQKPFLFTQSEPILARSWIPCQDGPGVRFTYNATVTVPSDLMAVMSAENPQQKTADGVYHFKQSHAIPSYLLALAVGDLAFKAIDARTGVYAEPSVVNKAAWEFADMGKMVDAAEKLYGPYRWGRYDVLVLPPSFPYGGMENPNLTFATPTVIAGDRSLVSLIAHELAHSWSGNLVTNANWNNMWLNEGFTTYFERRIVEALYGKDEAKMQEVLGRQVLDKTIAEMGATNPDSRLKVDFTGRDPDQATGQIAYEKGYAFLRTLEETAGREKFDAFLKKNFDDHAFQSRNTEQFLADVNKDLAGGDTSFARKAMIQQWVYEPGIPSNIPSVSSAAFNTIDTLISKWTADKQTAGLHQKIKSANELLYFLTHLPEVNITDMTALDKEFGFTNSGNAEVQSKWYVLSIRNSYKPAYPKIEQFLGSVGRRKLIVPLYKEAVKNPENKQWATTIYKKARLNYHPVTYNTVDEVLK
ncbi:M1 family metallopeptidase [Sediminibacterium ginsengisoli]|uniref:Aminopeptidase N n=1 Tax=Sediminibacterium ginsengisoli TaxID=413434 RepID=A0A1T4MBW3_9BACT|nr:M1 family metallopeptidase [Sediminibacterium ginsengisoli]SJZ64529.1 Leukotriene A4 hydrolase, C-terminal [Sediminibacterium ginsengisoli]